MNTLFPISMIVSLLGFGAALYFGVTVVLNFL